MKRLLCVCTLLATIVALGWAQDNKKSFVFRGKVEAVNAAANTMTVNGENVEGWMAAMTMDYKVDDAAILTKVKPGDQITATVYPDDYSLHKVQIAGKNSADTKSKK